MFAGTAPAAATAVAPAAAVVQIVWYELPSFYVFHIANAWEEDGKVKVGGVGQQHSAVPQAGV